MVLDLIFDFFSNYLIEFMSGLLVIGLALRWAGHRQSIIEDKYFSSFTNEIEKIILLNKEKGEKISDAESYLNELLDKVRDKLPTRNVRTKGKKEKNKAKATQLGAKNVVSMREYAQGDQGLFWGIRNESAAFKSKFPPNFPELTNRILENDDNWNKVLRFVPIGPVNRLIDILPGLFVVFGIFGTFIGISMALPEIAKIDFNNIESSGEILSNFVNNVTYAMKTSIAGILFSLLTTFLNTLAPVSSLRRKTYKRVSNSIESIWLSIHGEKTLEQEIHESLPAILEEVKAMRAYTELRNDKKAAS
jgi:hypothetical protein